METRTDPNTLTALDDELVRFREWGTERTHPLPAPHGDWAIGSAVSCWLRLQDDHGYVSRRHAGIQHEATGWRVQDEGSKNGLWQDGERRLAFSLAPGVVVGLGHIRLIAESPRTIRLRALLQRWIGWAPQHGYDVDGALRAIREVATARIPLLLVGEGNLVALARQLHREIVGPERPFAVSDPRRTRSAASARSAENYGIGMEAMHAAAGGTVAVWATRVPADFAGMTAHLRAPGNSVRLIVCARSIDELTSTTANAIEVPLLATRANELDRVIHEYALDAIARLGVGPSSFTLRDLEWIVARQPGSLSEIEAATMRLVAIRAFGGVTRAAPHLGITHAALSRWIGRRRLPA